MVSMVLLVNLVTLDGQAKKEKKVSKEKINLAMKVSQDGSEHLVEEDLKAKAEISEKRVFFRYLNLFKILIN